VAASASNASLQNDSISISCGRFSGSMPAASNSVSPPIFFQRASQHLAALTKGNAGDIFKRFLAAGMACRFQREDLYN
jgi:hypothetical protein